MINIVGLMKRIFFSSAPSNLFVRAEIGLLGIFVQQQMKRAGSFIWREVCRNERRTDCEISAEKHQSVKKPVLFAFFGGNCFVKFWREMFCLYFRGFFGCLPLPT